MCMCVFHIIYKMCVCQYEEVHMQSGRGKRGKSVFTAALLSMSLTLKCNLFIIHHMQIFHLMF